MKNGKFGTLSQLAQEVERQHEVKRDLVGNTANIEVYAPPEPDARFKMTSFVPGLGNESLDINDLALIQMSQKSDIPASYHRKLLKEDPELLAHNINTLHRDQPANRMIRTLDGTARAFMSDRYKRIDNAPILEAILPVLAEHGSNIKIESCDVTDNKMYLKIVSPRLQGEVKVGDVVQAGFVMGNSEVGLGSYYMQKLLYTLSCLNGMIRGDQVGEGLRRKHLGSKQDQGILYREETIIAEQRAFALQARDTISALLDEGNFLKTLEDLRETTTRKMAKQADPSKVIIELGKQVGFTQTEGKSIMQHLIEGGDLSQYGLANAVTRYAQDDEVSYDRSTELEFIGGKVVELTGRKLENILEAA